MRLCDIRARGREANTPIPIVIDQRARGRPAGDCESMAILSPPVHGKSAETVVLGSAPRTSAVAHVLEVQKGAGVLSACRVVVYSLRLIPGFDAELTKISGENVDTYYADGKKGRSL